MTDLLDDERFWDGIAVLDEPTDVVIPDEQRPAYDGDDDGYDYADGTA